MTPEPPPQISEPSVTQAAVAEQDDLTVQSPMRASTLLSSFCYAFAGIRYLLWTQRNAKIHAVVALLVILFGGLFGITYYEWLAIIIMIALVIAAEGVNTAIEAVVDLASPGLHPLARVAKDVAAGTVLLTAIAAVVIGILIFLPRLWQLLLSWL